MATRLPNPRRVKIHRSYTVDEVARLYGVHRNTVRQWIKQGLPVCNEQRPALILGRALAAYLTTKRSANKRPCKPGELYCLRCRAPKIPALNMVDYLPLTATGGRLVGICPTCEALLNQRVSLLGLARIRAVLDITQTQALQHIGDSGNPCVNSDFKTGAATHA